MADAPPPLLYFFDQQIAKRLVPSQFLNRVHIDPYDCIYSSESHDLKFHKQLNLNSSKTIQLRKTLQKEYNAWATKITERVGLAAPKPTNAAESFRYALDMFNADQTHFPFSFYVFSRFVIGCTTREFEITVRIVIEAIRQFTPRNEFMAYGLNGKEKDDDAENDEEDHDGISPKAAFSANAFIALAYRTLVANYPEDEDSCLIGGPIRLILWLYHMPVFFCDHPLFESFFASRESAAKFLKEYNSAMGRKDNVRILTPVLAGPLFAEICSREPRGDGTISQTFFYLPKEKFTNRGSTGELFLKEDLERDWLCGCDALYAIQKAWSPGSDLDFLELDCAQRGHGIMHCQSLSDVSKVVMLTEEAARRKKYDPKLTYVPNFRDTQKITMGKILGAFRRVMHLAVMPVCLLHMVEDMNEGREQFLHSEMVISDRESGQVSLMVIYARCHVLDQQNSQLLYEIRKMLAERARNPNKEVVDEFLLHVAADGDTSITENQKKHLRDMLLTPLSVIYGPPGTGKTSRGIQNVVRFFLEEEGVDPANIVCLAPTGKAFRELCGHLESLKKDFHPSPTLKKTSSSSSTSAPVLDVWKSSAGKRKRVDELELMRLNLEAEQADLEDAFSSGGVGSGAGGFFDNAGESEMYRLAAEGNQSSTASRKDEELLILSRHSMMESGGRAINRETLEQQKERIVRFQETVRPKLYSMFGYANPPPFIEYCQLANLPAAQLVNHPLRTTHLYNESLSGTVHRFLKVAEIRMKTAWIPERDGQELVFIMDELSMYSSFLMNRMLNLLRRMLDSHSPVSICKIIMAGDDRQLPSIGYGNVLSPLLQSESFQDNVRHYFEIKRQTSDNDKLKRVIGELRNQIESGRRNLELDLPSLFNQEGEGGEEEESTAAATETEEPETEEDAFTTFVRAKQQVCIGGGGGGSASAAPNSAEFVKCFLYNEYKQSEDEKRRAALHFIYRHPHWFSPDFYHRAGYKCVSKVVTYKNKDVDVWNKALQNVYWRYRIFYREAWKLQTMAELEFSFDSRPATNNRSAAAASANGEVKFVLYDLVLRRKNVRVNLTPSGDPVDWSKQQFAANKRKKDLVFSSSSKSATAAAAEKNISYLFSNGEEAFIIALDKEQELAELEYVLDGKREIVTFQELNRSFRLAYAQTIHSAQGSTQARTMMLMRRATDQSSLVWVGCSRPSKTLYLLFSTAASARAGRPVLRLINTMPITTFLMHRNNKYCAGACEECGQVVLSESEVRPQPEKTKQSRRVCRTEDCLVCGAAQSVFVELWI